MKFKLIITIVLFVLLEITLIYEFANDTEIAKIIYCKSTKMGNINKDSECE